jgi:phosphatidyl-myo-inositol dimannoside synthase
MGSNATHIVTADVPGSAEFDATYPLPVHRLKLERRWYYRPESLGMYVSLLRKTWQLALSHSFHSIHAGRVLPEGLIALLVARLSGRPCVVYAHGEEITTWLHGAKRKALEFVFRHADHVIANGSFTLELLRNLGVKEERLHLINPGVDLAVFRPGLDTDPLRCRYGLEGKRVILSVGRLSRRKGFDNVIRAMELISREIADAQHVVIGIGEDERYLKEIAASYGVSDKVTFVGAVAEEELPLWYNLCELFAMPNRNVGNDTEGFGMVFIEANACGRPVVAGRDGGTGDAVLHGGTGLRVDGLNVEEVAQAIISLLRERNLADIMGKRGLERVKESFGWEQVARKTMGILHGA